MAKKIIRGFKDLDGEKRIRINAVGFLRLYLADTDLGQAEVARNLQTTRQNFNRYCKNGGYLSKAWLDELAKHYPGGKAKYWALVQRYCCK